MVDDVETELLKGVAQNAAASAQGSGHGVIYRGTGSQLVEFEQDTAVVLGRTDPADIQVDDKSLSRRHARLLPSEEGLWVEDLGSTNGTFIDGARVDRQLLTADGEVRFGNVIMSVHLPRIVSPPPDDVVVQDPAMRQLYELCERVAQSNAPVLVYGETGTGKDVLARRIHQMSQRAKAPLRTVNCSAIPEALSESVLFGHSKGAFTGAERRTEGVFQQADGGTIFLDEVAELSPGAQAALLRVLENGEVQPVGSERPVRVDTRVISATHENLGDCCQRGAFRSDLLFRLNVVSLEVPPLRERVNEIGPLAKLFLQKQAQRDDMPQRQLTDDALTALKRYHWPGNVRELRNAVEHAALVARGATIGSGDLPKSFASRPAQSFSPSAATFKQRIRQYETRLIIEALEAAQWQRARAAELLKIPLRTLNHKISSYEIDKQH